MDWYQSLFVFKDEKDSITPHWFIKRLNDRFQAEKEKENFKPEIEHEFKALSAQSFRKAQEYPDYPDYLSLTVSQ